MPSNDLRVRSVAEQRTFPMVVSFSLSLHCLPSTYYYSIAIEYLPSCLLSLAAGVGPADDARKRESTVKRKEDATRSVVGAKSDERKK